MPGTSSSDSEDLRNSTVFSFPVFFSVRKDLAIFLGPLLFSGIIAYLMYLYQLHFMQDPQVHLRLQNGIFTPVMSLRFIFVKFFAIAIDVPHSYATLLKVYLDKRIALFDFFSLVVVLLFLIGAGAWYFTFFGVVRIFAYLDIFHYIRQQYGWIALSQRKQLEIGGFERFMDRMMIYNVTLAPMLWWHCHPTLSGWFVSGDLLCILPEWFGTFVLSVHWVLVACYLVFQSWLFFSGKTINLQKLLLLTVTWFAWYVGILYCLDGIKSLMANFLHSVPYLFLVLRYSASLNENVDPAPLNSYFGWNWLRQYLPLLALSSSIVAGLLFLRTDQGKIPGWYHILFLLGPATHYLFDSVIWKVNAKNASLVKFLKLRQTFGLSEGEAPR